MAGPEPIRPPEDAWPEHPAAKCPVHGGDHFWRNVGDWWTVRCVNCGAVVRRLFR